VKASRSGGVGPRHDGASSAAARVRISGPDFQASFRALQEGVRRTCAAETQWQARIVVGVRAVLEFAAADPKAARALTIQARNGEEGADREDEVIAYFAELLARVAPAEKRVDVSTETGLVDTIATIIRGHLLAGSAAELPGKVPDLVYLTLMPYTGLGEARRWASFAPAL